MAVDVKVWKIEYRTVESLVEYERNPRRITKERFEKLKERLISQGFRVPPSLDNDGVILAGHQRYRALIDLGLGKIEIPVSIPPFQLTEDQRREIIAADNISWGEFDYDILASDYEIEELLEIGMTEEELVGEMHKLDESYTDNFELPTGDKSPFQQITFNLADEQASLVKSTLGDIKKTESFKYVEKFGNENSNGNALYELIQQWVKLNK